MAIKWKGWMALSLTVMLLLGMVSPTASAADTWAAAVVSASDVYINPVYADEAQEETVGFPTLLSDGEAVTYITERTALVAQLRSQMVARQSPVVLYYETDENYETLMREVLFEALEHTGVPNEGDYIRWHLSKCDMVSSGTEEGGKYYLTLTYTINYRTTAQQEAAVDKRLKEVLDELNVYEATERKKSRVIYDYICQNVSYDHVGVFVGDKGIFTAYAALIKGSAVCQGYASLFYRMALELGLDARLISGTFRNQNHGWNIVKVEGKYYNMDATKDALNAYAKTEYEYFLENEAGFSEHIRAADYTTEAFYAAYPMSEESYIYVTPGDYDDDCIVNDKDAFYLLWYTLFPDEVVIYQSPDVNNDTEVNDRDAFYMLWYTLFPELYPLFPANTTA